MTAENEGELEYGSILSNGEDWRLRKFDAGMGETEYRVFKNEKFFAQLDNRKDADTVMVAMTRPNTPQAERERVLDELEKKINDEEPVFLFTILGYIKELRKGGEQ